MNLYIDIDSSFRNRQEYPNPADFVIISKQDTISADFECIRNSTSQQIVLYPPFETNPLLFYLNPSGTIIEKQYLPYMYKTNDPRVIQLDELSIGPTRPEDAGEIILDDLYPRGSIPLGQANQFYTGDYLENFDTKETRKIISFIYEKSNEIVFQSSQVLWASLIGDQFKIGVSPISSTTIPPSNIYNYYRGKYLKMITGRARNFKSLITDYNAINPDLSVFTLSSYSGVLPQQGDIFQIVSDRRWYATIESPFSTDLPAYPAYQQELPVTDIQFSSNTIYTTTENIISVSLSPDRDISFVLGNSSIVLIDAIDPLTNFFWKSPILINTNFQNKNSIYTGEYIYYVSFTDTAQTRWSISRFDTAQSILTNNILTTDFIYSNTPFEANLLYLEINTSIYLATVYFQSSNYTIIFYCNGSLYSYMSSSSIIIHSLKEYNGLPFLIWSEFNSSTQKLYYYFSIATSVDGSGIFSVNKMIVEVDNISDIFSHYIQKLDTIVWNSQIITTIINYDTSTDKFTYEIYMSDTGGKLWFWSTVLLSIDTTLLDSSKYRGTEYIYYNNKFYFFFWDPNYGLSYIYTQYPQYLSNPFFDDKFFSPIITIQSKISVRDAYISTNSNGFFITFIQNNRQIVVLNSESFVISEAVPYRIRKTAPAFFNDIIPFAGNSALSITLENPIEYLAGVGNSKFVLYTDIYNQWIVTENNKLHYSSDLIDWKENSEVIPESFDWHYTVQVKELNALNSLVVENSYSNDLVNKSIFSIVAGSQFFMGIAMMIDEITSQTTFYFLTAQRVGDKIDPWISTPLYPELNIMDTFNVVTIEYSPSLGLYSVAGFLNDQIFSMMMYATYNTMTLDWDWNYTELPIQSEIKPTTVVWSPNAGEFVTTGLITKYNPSFTITTSNAIRAYELYNYTELEIFELCIIEAGTYPLFSFQNKFSVNELSFTGPITGYTYTYNLALEYIDGKMQFIGNKTVIKNEFDPPVISGYQFNLEYLDFIGSVNYEFADQIGFITPYFSMNTPYTPITNYYYTRADEVPLFDYSGIAFKSTDGINWSLIPLRIGSQFSLFLRSGVWSPLLGIFVFVGDAYVYIYRPSDGFNQLYFVNNIEWEEFDYFYNITWSPELEIFCAVTNRRIYTSSDGITWTLQFYGEYDGFYDIVWSPELRIFFTTSLQQILISFNGADWTRIDYIILLSTYNSFIWDSILKSFCGISDRSGVSTLIFNSSSPRKYVCAYFQSDTTSIVMKSTTTTTLDWELSKETIVAGTGNILPKMIKIVFLDKINIFTAITSDYFWFSSEGNVWYAVQLFTELTDENNNPYTIVLDSITDYIWDTDTSTIYFITKTYNRLFYSTNVNQLIINPSPTVYSYLIPYPNSIFSKIAYSNQLGFVITTLKPSNSTIDFIRSSDKIQWSTALSTNVAHNNIAIVWNSYFRCYIGLSELNNIRVLILSADSYQWYIYQLSNDFYGMDFNQLKIGLVSNDLTLFADLKIFLSTNTLRTLSITQNGQLWLYNRETTYDVQTYEYINNIYNILDYQNDILTLDRYIQFYLPYYIYSEILGDTIDNFNGMNMPFKQNQPKCYSITLQDLVLPNQVLQTYIGNQISFYPYIYIVIQNEKTDRHSIYAMITNHPKMSQATFKISVSQFSSDPSRLPYIRLFSPITVKANFNIEAPIRFSIHLPNGELFQMVEQDTLPPDAPNPLLQVSATFKFSL